MKSFNTVNLLNTHQSMIETLLLIENLMDMILLQKKVVQMKKKVLKQALYIRMHRI